ncbi:MAG: DHHW family protein [Bacteroidota bacterium]
METEGNKNHTVAIANTVMFLFVVFWGLILLVTLPKQEIALSENRKLAAFPKITNQKIWDGTLMKEFDVYVSDHFPLRNWWITMSDEINSWKGLSNQEITYYVGDNNVQAATTDETAPLLDVIPADSIIAMGDSALLDSLQYVPVDYDDYQKVNSIIVYNQRAVQVFGASSTVSGRYARLMGIYADALGPGVKIYCMPVPIGSDFNLPPKVKGEINREKENIDHLFSLLPAGVRGVRTYEKLSAKRNEYIYFKSDHHWTGRGAYYGYNAFCEAAGLNPLPMTALNKVVGKGFLGSLYNRTRSEVLRQDPDSVEVFMVPNKTEVKYLSDDQKTWKKGKLYHGSSGYSAYVGRDYPLMVVETDIKNGKSIMVIKDSYGNPFSTFLAAHYERVYIVDYRYYEGSVLDLIAKNKIGELVFTHNLYVINSSFTFSRETALMKGGKGIPRRGQEKAKTIRDSTSVDSLNKNMNQPDSLKNEN